MRDATTDVRAVQRIRFEGAPEQLLLDEPALLNSQGSLSPWLYAKLKILADDEGIRLTVAATHVPAVEQALSGISNATVAHSTPSLDARLPGLAILANPLPLPAGVYAWLLGRTSAPPGFHPSPQSGPEGTDTILALYGTALVQERAGFAFRAASRNEPIPREAPFDPDILAGVSAAIMPSPQQVARLQERTFPAIDLDRETEELVAAALPPLMGCQGESGAIAGAPPPRSPNEPNYWFFWQRDAGQAAAAMALLMKRSSDPHRRELARGFVSRYLDFVDRLPHMEGVQDTDLGISRFEMTGQPIRTYGNPQNDGPAYTVLAVVAALGYEARAYRVAKPYLDYLSRHIFEPSFDPWEFAVGAIFADFILARRALRTGAILARRHGDSTAAEEYGRTADEIEERLEGFRDLQRGYLVAGRDFAQPWMGTISNLDIDVVIGALASYDLEDPFLNVDDPLMVQTVRALDAAFAKRWPVNIAWSETGRSGLGIGRFPEDANDGKRSTGGNPWTLATLAAAEYYFRLVERLDYVGYGYNEKQTREQLLQKADGYVQFVLSHVPPGNLTEQIDGQTGEPGGARQLAWAQAALIRTLLLRREVRRVQ